jgi:hypothetical protein
VHARNLSHALVVSATASTAHRGPFSSTTATTHVTSPSFPTGAPFALHPSLSHPHGFASSVDVQ